MTKIRWKLYGLLVRSRRVCPANAHAALIWRTRPLREITVDYACRKDLAANGSCWCGNLQKPGSPSSSLRSCCHTDPEGGHRGTCQHSMMNGGNWDDEP